MAAAAIPLVSAGIGALGSLFGGLFGARGAKKAAETQARAADEAGDIAAQEARDAISRVENATGSGQTWTLDAANQAAEDARVAGATGRDVIRSEYEAGLDRLSPYLTAGQTGVEQLAAMMGPGGELNRRFSTEDFQVDPGYAFRMAEGTKALERSAAARGRVLGGAQLKALARYGQGLGSQEYQNAFERFRAENADRTARFLGLSAIGERATGQANNLGTWYGGTNLANLMDTARMSGDYMTRGADLAGELGMRGATTAGEFGLRGAQLRNEALTGGANARSAGTAAANQAWGQGIAGAGRSVMDSILLGQMMGRNGGGGNNYFAQPWSTFQPPATQLPTMLQPPPLPGYPAYPNIPPPRVP